jgi:hypothetical protein
LVGTGKKCLSVWSGLGGRCDSTCRCNIMTRCMAYVLYCTVLCCAVLCCAVLYSRELYG